MPNISKIKQLLALTPPTITPRPLLRLNEKDANGWTLLTLSILNFDRSQEAMDLIKSLLIFGADPEIKCERGLNAFHHICEIGHFLLLKLWVEFKCNLNLLSDEGKTGIHYALEMNKENTFVKLIAIPHLNTLA